jgi:hypothetical protein
LSKLRNTGCNFTLTEGTGIEDDISFTWSSETYDPVVATVADPVVLRSEFLNLPQPYLTAAIAHSSLSTALIDFQDRTKISSWLRMKEAEEQILSSHLEFIWVFLQRNISPPYPSQGVLHVQSIFASVVPSKTGLVKNTMRLTAVSILAFILTILLSIIGTQIGCIALVAFVPYFVGWAFVVYAVSVILSFVPQIFRPKESVTATFSRKL